MKREIFLKYIPEVASALSQITEKPKEKIEKKLEDLVLHKLKMEDLEEAKEKEEDDDFVLEEKYKKGEDDVNGDVE
jgi:DNA topoisomerase VI subunit B